MLEIFTLIALFQVKHYVCDYAFQMSWMLQQKRHNWKWLPPTVAHAALHAAAAFLILIGYGYWLGDETVYRDAPWLASVNFGVYFLVDRVKIGMLGRYKAIKESDWESANRRQRWHCWMFWQTQGMVHLLHGLTSLYVLYRLFTRQAL